MQIHYGRANTKMDAAFHRLDDAKISDFASNTLGREYINREILSFDSQASVVLQEVQRNRNRRGGNRHGHHRR